MWAQYDMKAKVTAEIANAKQIQKALFLFKDQYGYYPLQAGTGGDPNALNGVDICACNGGCGSYSVNGFANGSSPGAESLTFSEASKIPPATETMDTI